MQLLRLISIIILSKEEKMKRKLIYAFIAVIAVTLFFSCKTALASSKNVSVSLPSFKVILNGNEMNNSYSKYPLIVYKNITYFPMTYEGCRYLGLETKWDQKDGLEINKTNISYPFEGYKTNQRNLNSYTAAIPEFNIKINGKAVDKNNAEYPLLSFRDVTYFPLTWEYGVNKFGWDYRFDSNNGLVINSQNASPKLLELTDYLYEDGGYGQFIVHGEYIYYTGNKGVIYQAPLNELKNNKKIYQLPINRYFGEDAYGYPYFRHHDGKVIFSYHLGGASTGITYEIAINLDGTITEPKTIGPFIGWPAPTDEGLILNVSKIRNLEYSQRTESYETDSYSYMVAFNERVADDSSRIYKLNKATGKITLVNEKPASAFKYRNEKLYFVSEDSMLYSLSLTDESVRLEISEPIYRENYEVLGKDIYYINDNDRKIYREGDRTPINSGETGEAIQLTGNYVVLRFNTTLNVSYRTMVYDKNGNAVFILPREVIIVSADSNRMTYFDGFEKKVFLVEMK